MTNEQIESVKQETIKTFINEQWFRGVTVYEKHPNTGEATVELRVNYIPLFEKKNVIAFAQKVNMAYRFLIIDKAGNPVE